MHDINRLIHIINTTCYPDLAAVQRESRIAAANLPPGRAADILFALSSYICTVTVFYPGNHRDVTGAATALAESIAWASAEDIRLIRKLIRPPKAGTSVFPLVTAFLRTLDEREKELPINEYQAS